MPRCPAGQPRCPAGACRSRSQGYFRVRDGRARRAVETLAPLQIDRHGHRTMPLVERLAASERLRRQIGQIAVPLGQCTEPSNVKAHGHGCPEAGSRVAVRSPQPARVLT